MTVYQNIKRLRKERGLRQKDIAKLTGVAMATYQRWEQGKHSIRVEKLLALAKALGVTLNEVLDDGEELEGGVGG